MKYKLQKIGTWNLKYVLRGLSGIDYSVKEILDFVLYVHIMCESKRGIILMRILPGTRNAWKSPVP